MDSPPDPGLSRFSVDFYASLSDLARDLGIEVCDDAFVVSGSSLDFLKSFAEAGGCWTEVPGHREWHVDHILARNDSPAEPADSVRPVLLSDYPGIRRVSQVTGIFQLELNGQRALLASRSEPPPDTRSLRRDTLILLGASYQSCFKLIKAAFGITTKPRVTVWGSDMHRLDPEPVSEAHVVLRDDLKRELLGTLDRFWSLADRLKDLGIPARRGVLLAGPPGTGKTLMTRHLLSRYPHVPAHLFISSRPISHDDPFGAMLSAVRRERDGAIVILEDLDHLSSSNATTREFLLNCLDGLLEMEVPILWIATSNNPTLLEENLLNRPGRFDRVIVFPLPGPEEREAMIRAYSRLQIDDVKLFSAVSLSEGLTGAHLREASSSAMLESLDSGEAYGSTLIRAIQVIKGQHTYARRLERGLNEAQAAGFRN